MYGEGVAFEKTVASP